MEWAALKEGAKSLNLEQDAEQLPATAEEVREGETFWVCMNVLLMDDEPIA